MMVTRNAFFIKETVLTIVIGVFLWLCMSCSNSANNRNTWHTIEYTNPILHLDYSDPDVVKVGDKYYMTTSSFNCIPGLPILESDNLVDWKLITYALDRLSPDAVFSKPQHGNGVWAPSIRYHNNQFYIYYGDPDYGIYMLSATNINGPWTKPHLVQAGKGWIDPCPFWDKDGTAWLVHAWAGSRAGIKTTLTLHKMSADGKSLLDNGIIIFDGHEGHTTVEGPKMYERNGYYYVFAPAGGVTQGWQLALRSKNITGPYEFRKVLHQGNTKVNGPHQGAWVYGHDSSSWFYHFQDKEAFGRIVHLQPMQWVNDWPIMGNDMDHDGIGEPVLSAKVKSLHPKWEQAAKPYNDEFNTADINLHWQWHANTSAKYGAPSAYLGYMRLYAAPFAAAKSLWDAPNLLMQKFPSNAFEASTKFDIFLKEENDRTGLLIMGYDYAWLGVERKNEHNYLVYKQCLKADKGGVENTLFSIPFNENTVYLKTVVNEHAQSSFAYSNDGENFTFLPQKFVALPGKWIGAKVGLFCISSSHTNDAGYVNVDWFRYNE